MGLEYLDLYLLHWPVAFNPNGNHQFEPKKEDGSVDIIPGSGEPEELAKVYKEMEKLVKSGKVKSIGVSNFSIKKLQKFLPLVSIPPVTNQVSMRASPFQSHPSDTRSGRVAPTIASMGFEGVLREGRNDPYRIRSSRTGW